MLPVVFISHGTPLSALDAEKRSIFSSWAKEIEVPRFILVISAHWETEGVCIGTTKSMPLIYDFDHFPPELYQIQYSAPPAEQLAERVRALFSARGWEVQERNQRGWDHGVWVPLVQMYPEQTIPILQISLPMDFSPNDLVMMGKILYPLREEGVLIMGSGQITHHLSAKHSNANAEIEPWAREFDEWIKQKLMNWEFYELVMLRMKAPFYRENHPTEEHLFPFYVTLGAALTMNGKPEVKFYNEGFEYGTLSQRCIQFS